MKTRYGLVGLIGIALVALALGSPEKARAEGAPSTAASTVTNDLMKRDLLSVPGKEIRVLTVEYVPGGASLPHRHNAQVFVYLLEGSVRMQVEGSPTAILGPGAVFYEGPDDIHTVSANASATRPAKMLVFMLVDKNSPGSVTVRFGERP